MIFSLLEAAKIGDVALIWDLLDAGADIEQPDEHGNTALILASRQGHAAAAGFLLDRGANPDARTGDEGTALHAARNYETAVALLARGLRANIPDMYGSTALHWAVCKPECGDALLDWGADIEAQDEDGYTPAWRAFEDGVDVSLLMLVLRGASIAPMRTGTVGASVYPTNKEILVGLALILSYRPGVENVLREKRPDVMAAVESLLATDASVPRLIESNRQVHIREQQRRRKKREANG